NKILSCACRPKKSVEIRTLDFRNQHLAEVPADAFKNEATLEVLLLDHNKLTELRKELFCCRSLFKLSLSNNCLQCLPPSIGSLCNLGELSLKNNSLVELPDEIKACKYLHTLDLSGNLFEVLPEDISSLSHLANLTLNECSLRKLPNTLGRLGSLCVLEVRGNKLRSLPACIGRLKSLERLDAGENELELLPESFGELQSLCDCWLDKNRLSCLPASIGQLTSLSFFDLSGNRIETLPHELGLCAALCDLNLSANLLRCLPDTVDGLTGLAGLRLDANRLLQLPQSIGRLSALCDLNISSNLLACLPPTIGLLRQLQTLHADCNRLTELPSSIGSCSSLTILSLRANLLRFVPDEIGHLQELRVLNLSANRLDCLPISMLRLPDLQALWLSDNQTEPLPRLQPEDVLAGKAVLRVLTCYLLPQLPVPLATLREEDELDDFNSMERQRTVQFAVDGGESPSDAAEDRHLPKDLPDGRRRVWAACVPTSTERVGLASCLRRCLPCVTSNSSSAESAAHYLPHLPTLGNPDGVTTEVANSPSDDAAKTTTAASRQNPLDLVSPLSTSSPLSGHQAVSNGSDPNNNNNGTSDAYEMVLLQDATPVATIRIRPGDHSHSHLRQHYGYDSDGGLPAARVRSLPATVAPLSRRGSHPGSQLPPIAQSESALTPPLHQPPPPPPPPPRGPHWPTAPSGPAAPIAVPEDSASSDSGYGGRRPAPAPPPARSPPPTPPQIHNLPPSSGIRVPPVRTSTASVAVLPDADFRSGGSSSEFSVPVAAAASTLLLWVTIDRGPTLGFSVSGGADTAEGGVFVSRLLPNCPASDLLRFGDRILQVNEMPFGGLSHSEAVQFLKAQGRVRLLIQRSVSSEP
uniref:PDZ domain-containing protein n=1 Tax=Macrostomum lignano TaxID=282301 RepID=A0A1I8J389_9PLAT